MHHFCNVSWDLPAFQQPGKQIACGHSKGQGCHHLSEIAGTSPVNISLCSSWCQHKVLSSAVGWAFVGSFCTSFQWETLVFLVSYSPWCKNSRGRKAQRVNVHLSELLGVARCAGCQEGNPAGPNNPLTLQVPFSLVQHRGVNISEQMFTLQLLW